MKPVKPSRSHSRHGITAALIERASRPGGCCAADLPEWTRRQVGNNACGLVAEGRLISIGALKVRRFFTSQADADAYAAQLPEVRKAQQEAYRERARQANVQRMAKRRAGQSNAQQKAAAEPPVKLAESKVKWKDQPAVVPAHVKVQKCPSPPHFGPAARLWGTR